MDPSGSFGADQASGQSSQTKDNIGMEPVYYNAAAKIEIGVLKDIPKPLNQLLTPNRNIVLHIHLTSPIKISEDSKSESSEPAQAEVNIGMKADYYNGAANGTIGVFKDIPEPLDQLLTPNRNTVLHIYLSSLKESELSTAFVEEILEMCPPLHEAVRGNHLEVVKRLIEEGKIFSYSQNDAGETPLYIAVERNYEEVAFHILETCTSPAPDGPHGRTT